MGIGPYEILGVTRRNSLVIHQKLPSRELVEKRRMIKEDWIAGKITSEKYLDLMRHAAK